MERDYNELQYDFDMFKKRSERAGNELENTNKKLNTQIHNGKKEIVLLKEVSLAHGHMYKHVIDNLCCVSFSDS